ncbi:MAG: response regulator [Candidatus Omnitrophota bacterium]
MGKRILIIDDEPDMAEVMEMRFASKGYEISVASHGVEGLESMQRQRPDLILLDIMMPVMDGFEFFKTVRNGSAGLEIPIVVVSARAGMKATFEAIGAADFIEKPFDLDMLLSKVSFHLESRAVILAQVPFVVTKIKAALKDCGYEVDEVADEGTVIMKSADMRRKIFVAHLALISSSPKDFMAKMNASRNSGAKVVIYSDAHVKGTEDNSTALIDELRIKWTSAGAALFYDSRINGAFLRDEIKKLLGVRR